MHKGKPGICPACHAIVATGGLHKGAAQILAARERGEELTPRDIGGGCRMNPHPETRARIRREKRRAAQLRKELGTTMRRGQTIAGTGKPSASHK